MAFAKLKAPLRKAAEQSVRIGSFIPTFSPQECANYLGHASHAAT
jgi:hypothetical protein